MPLFDFAEAGEASAATRFDHYEIFTHPDGSLVELGRGSMGITYHAFDTTLQFPVALKVIDFKAAGQDRNRERFLREARATARLRHPHVASVLYYGVRQDGQCFYAMELVEGETLAERMRRSGPLLISDALEVIAQVASALEAAEEHGLVHRDLKPANLMLASGPGINVKVIDFGLAKIVGSQELGEHITQDGFVGTPAFASPEQFSGAEVDRRSDYFSLGSVLFYLITATPPFKADQIPTLTELNLSDAIAKRREIDQRAPIARLKSLGVPPLVRDLVISLLSASPENRPQNGAALQYAITKCRQAIAKTKRTSRKTIITIAAGVGLLTVATLCFFSIGISAKDSAAKSIAVLPFDNLSPAKDDSYFADGIQDDILTNLAKIADLRVISRGSVQGYRDPANRPLPREIGQALNARYLLIGSIRREGERIRVIAKLEEALSGYELWAERYDGELTDVFEIQAELAEAISEALRAKLSTAEKSSISDIPTHDLAAYELYLHANELLANYDQDTKSTDSVYSAIRLLEEAVHRDPAFALAWAKLARAHDDLYWPNADHTESRRAAAETALQTALRLRPDLGDVHLEAGYHLLVTTRDYPAIRRELETARRTLPNSAKLFSLLANVASRQGEWREALQDYERASTLDPKNVRLIIALSSVYDFHRQYDEVRRRLGNMPEPGANAQSIEFKKALLNFQEKGDTSGFHALFDEPAGSLRAVGLDTILKVTSALMDRNYSTAEKILALDPQPAFEADTNQFACRDFVLGWIKASEGDTAAAKVAFGNARPLQLAYVQQRPNDPNALMMLALNDAELGHQDEALREGERAVTLRPISQDAIDGPVLAFDLAQLYLLTGQRDLAIKQLESLQQVPQALTYGELTMPDWDPIRNDPRFRKIVSELKAIPIVNRSERAPRTGER